MNFLLKMAMTTILLTSACGNGTDKKTTDIVPIDAATDGGETRGEECKRFKLVGQPCDDDCECLGNLCLLNEYAPFRYCTKSCGDSPPGTHCEPDVPGAPWNSLCVKFPAKEFLVEPSQFCAPLCEEMSDCVALGAPWETCQGPLWLGNPLYPSVPEQVCISPSAQGHEPVNPDTCEGWDGLYTEFGLERTTCAAYCDFLDTCQLLDSATSLTCCAFHCTSRMVPNGKVDKAYFMDIRCYVDTYNGFQNTALVCTQPQDKCGADPDQP